MRAQLSRFFAMLRRFLAKTFILRPPVEPPVPNKVPLVPTTTILVKNTMRPKTVPVTTAINPPPEPEPRRETCLATSRSEAERRARIRSKL